MTRHARSENSATEPAADVSAETRPYAATTALAAETPARRPAEPPGSGVLRTARVVLEDEIVHGLVELHTDHLAVHYAPRPGVRWNVTSAIRRLVALMDHAPGQRQFASMVECAKRYQGALKMDDATFRAFVATRVAESERHAAPRRRVA